MDMLFSYGKAEKESREVTKMSHIIGQMKKIVNIVSTEVGTVKILSLK